MAGLHQDVSQPIRESQILNARAPQVFDRGMAIGSQTEQLHKDYDAVNRARTANSEDLNTCNNAIEDCLESQGRAECLTLCHIMTAQLPLELREMIYTYVIDSSNNLSTITVSDQKDSCTQTEFCYSPHSSCTEPCSSHLFDVGYVGEEILREFVQVWFRNVNVIFNCDLSLISPFLMSDRWNIGVPAYSSITTIRLRIGQEHFLFPCDGLTHLRGLDVLQPSPRVTLFLDLIKQTPYGMLRIEKMILERAIAILWPFVGHLAPSRLPSIVLGQHDPELILSDGGDTLESWLDKLKKTVS